VVSVLTLLIGKGIQSVPTCARVCAGVSLEEWFAVCDCFLVLMYDTGYIDQQSLIDRDWL